MSNDSVEFLDETRRKDVRQQIGLTSSANMSHHYIIIINNIYILEDVPLVEFMYLVFTRIPGESYRRRLRSMLLYLCYVFRALINSFVR